MLAGLTSDTHINSNNESNKHLSNNYIGSDSNFLGSSFNKINNPYYFDTQKDINIK